MDQDLKEQSCSHLLVVPKNLAYFQIIWIIIIVTSFFFAITINYLFMFEWLIIFIIKFIIVMWEILKITEIIVIIKFP